MRHSKEGTKPSLAAQLTRTQLLRLLRATDRQLSNWERKGWIHPSQAASPVLKGALPGTPKRSRSPRPPCYSFADVAALKTILQLRRSGIPARLLRSIYGEARNGPGVSAVSQAWNDLQVQSYGKRLSVSYQGGRMEPVTGQLLLDFTPRRELSNVHPMNLARRQPQPSEADRRARADRLFLAGLRYEERPETIPKAIRAYQQAIELNPRALGAFINLGTIYYHQGAFPEAKESYCAALALNPSSALVHFNLGNLLEEQGHLDAAPNHYEEAIRLDPAYPDPRFNLALVFEQLGRHGKACQQWRWYLRLDSESRWAAYARQRLEQVPLRVVSSARPQNERG